MLKRGKATDVHRFRTSSPWSWQSMEVKMLFSVAELQLLLVYITMMIIEARKKKKKSWCDEQIGHWISFMSHLSVSYIIISWLHFRCGSQSYSMFSFIHLHFLLAFLLASKERYKSIQYFNCCYFRLFFLSNTSLIQFVLSLIRNFSEIVWFADKRREVSQR